MKKALFALTICLALTGNVFAVENTTTLTSDITQKKYERKTAVSIGELEFQKTFVRLPVIDNTKKGAADVITSIIRSATGNTVYTYPITDAQIEELTRIFYKYVITQRFDKLNILPDQVILMTKTGEATLNAQLPQPSIPQGIGLNEYRSKVERYLNGNIAPIMKKLMEITLDQRYRELPEQEKATFITQKAKELGLTAEVAEKLMNSGFAFATYIPTIEGAFSLNISQGLEKLAAPYNAKISLQAKPILLVYKFDGDKGKFTFYKEIKGDSGATIESKPLKAPIYNQAFYQDLFNKVLFTTVKAAAINTGMKLKEDDDFAIFTPAEEVEDKTFKAKIGVAETIRIDAPFDIYEFENGKKVYKGFGKAREVAYNCEINSTNKTKFALIRGKVEEYDLLREHPWSGVLFGIQFGTTPFTVTEVAGYTADGGGDWNTFRVTIDADLGYIRNSKTLSEWWLKLFAGGGSGGDDINIPALGATISPDSYIEGGLGIYKRIYLGTTGFAVTPGIDLSYRYLQFTGTAGDKLTIGAVTLTPHIGVVYNLTANFEINGEIGYPANISSDTTYTDIWGIQYTGTAQTEGGMNFFIGASYHFGIVGSLSKLYSEPPSCRRAK
ncbi:hypothetical protein [Desulfurobacterium indicum]|uniref:Uncharacterized protein n=1 Tax=Desulfurobacterium indicum TaxID=1914305 RepID=A0A1R1MK49_9BACT|nr:hypothetical protein [Desulfurobacterium indicum]OMH40074.1 hypothetical protein BLW93_07060 [Desulfurobacterium indicum]